MRTVKSNRPHPGTARFSGPAWVGLRFTGPLKRAVPVILLSTLAAGCTKPSAANIALRKQVQDLSAEIEDLKRQHAADLADDAVQPGSHAATQPISAAQADGLFTTHGVRFGRLTQATNAGVELHLILTDDDGNDFKAAGAIAVDLFDLSDAGRRVGQWNFDAAATRKMWNGTGLRYEYVVECPWPQPPAGKEWTLKVTFTDALTGRVFTAEQSLALRPE
ncbi:MAG: hypothetical protein QM754_12265 [Tepidisphaeraceae bacterium]